MSIKKITGACAVSAAVFMLAACGGGGDDTSPNNPNNANNPNSPNNPNAPVVSGLLPETIEFDVVEELLRPRATVPLEVELEAGRDRDVPASGAANVQVRIVQDGTGGARLSGSQFSTNPTGEARFSVTLGNNTGTVIVEATTDRADNNVANGITDGLSVLLGMVVTQAGDGLNWELPAVVSAGAGGATRLEDADDGARGARTYSVSGRGGFTLDACGDDVCLRTPANTAAGSYSVTMSVTDAAGATLSMPVTVAVR